MKYIFLIVDDNYEFASTLKKELEEELNYLIKNIEICTDGEKALKKIEKMKPNILLLDLEIPKVNGLMILEKTKEIDIPTIIMSGEIPMINDIKISYSKNIKRIFIKPFSYKSLINELKYIFCEMNNQKLKEKIEKELDIFSFNKSSIGYKYIITCLLYSYTNPALLNNIEKNLFPLISKEFRVNHISNIKWAMQKAIKSMIRYTDRKKILEYFHCDQIPTLKLFIITMNNIIMTKYKN